MRIRFQESERKEIEEGRGQNEMVAILSHHEERRRPLAAARKTPRQRRAEGRS